MKKTILLTICIALAGSLVGQTCQYKHNGIDKFTQKRVTETKKSLIYKAKAYTISIGVLSIDSEYALLIHYTENTALQKYVFFIKENYEVRMLLNDGSVVILRAADNSMSNNVSLADGNLLTVGNRYSIRKEDLLRLSKIGISAIRIELNMGTGKTFFETSEQTNLKNETLFNLINCVL
jgi:hypothetical protein